tara:strand:- start:5559 stop:6152 length:594 start_codon:yes stop_codon:yes gene_type:complete
MDKKINIYGASGHAKSVISVVESAGYEVGLLLDDDRSITSLLNYPVHAPEEMDTTPMLIAVGNNKTRKQLAATYPSNITPAIIHPTAVIALTSIMEEGTVVMPNAVVNADSRVGKHCIINTGAVVEHDCVLGNYVHISPNAALAGEVTVGEGSHIGIGACVIPGITIGKWCTIGAGAVIIKDVPDGVTVVGNPGREV